MKKRFFTIVLIIVLSLASAVPAFAQTDLTKAPGTWVSSINIQNTGDGEAQVSILFYNKDGVNTYTFNVTPNIPAKGSRSYYLPTQVTSLGSGQFSAVVSSNQPLQVVTNLASSAPYTSGAYMGFQSDQIGTILFFPGLYKNYYEYYSEIVLQNTEATAATVTIEFYSQATGSKIAGADVTGATIPGNSSRVFAMQDLAGVPSGNTTGLISAKVTSTTKLAGIGNVWSSAASGFYSDYNGYVGGSATVYTPALYKSYYGFNSALTVQNIDTADATVKVTYSNGVIENVTLKPNQAKEYFQPNNAALPSGNTNGVFSAKVESTNSMDVVVLVSVRSSASLASYNGPASAITKVGCPVTMQKFYGWFSAETVQNVGTIASDIKITYATGQTKTFNDVPANGTINIVENTGSGTVLPDVSSVSAVIESLDGQPIVAVVQENNYSPSGAGDWLLAYTCVPQP